MFFNFRPSSLVVLKMNDKERIGVVNAENNKLFSIA